MSKYTPQVIYRCQSCGAAIRHREKYHKLFVKGVPYIYCELCIALSQYTADIKDDAFKAPF